MIKSNERMSLNFNSLIRFILLILFPIKVEAKIYGVKPIKVTNINFEIFIFKRDKRKFCIPNGAPGIILKIIKYSIDDFWIYLLILF